VIIFDSADLDSAVEGVVDAIWFNQGQVGYVLFLARDVFVRTTRRVHYCHDVRLSVWDGCAL